AARADDAAGVVHRVARLEERAVGTGGLHHARRVPAEDLRRRLNQILRRAALGVHGVHRYRLHLHQQVPARRLGSVDFQVEQRLRIVDGQVLVQADGFHAGNGSPKRKSPAVPGSLYFFTWRCLPARRRALVFGLLLRPGVGVRLHLGFQLAPGLVAVFLVRLFPGVRLGLVRRLLLGDGFRVRGAGLLDFLHCGLRERGGAECERGSDSDDLVHCLSPLVWWCSYPCIVSQKKKPGRAGLFLHTAVQQITSWRLRLSSSWLLSSPWLSHRDRLSSCRGLPCSPGCARRQRPCPWPSSRRRIASSLRRPSLPCPPSCPSCSGRRQPGP